MTVTRRVLTLTSRLIVAATLLAGFLFVTGCDSASESSRALIISVPMEAPSQYPTAGTVLAWVSVDGGERMPLEVNTTNETLSGIVEGVSEGNHTIVIVIEFDDDVLGVLEIARTSLPVDVDGDTTIILQQSDYTHGNDDSDTYVNVQELIAGSDPFDGASIPPAGSVPAGGRWNTMVWDQTNWR